MWINEKRCEHNRPIRFLRNNCIIIWEKSILDTRLIRTLLFIITVHINIIKYRWFFSLSLALSKCLKGIHLSFYIIINYVKEDITSDFYILLYEMNWISFWIEELLARRANCCPSIFNENPFITITDSISI